MKTISVVATELSSGFQYVSNYGRKVYKENSFITQQIGYIKHSLIFEYLYPMMTSTTPTMLRLHKTRGKGTAESKAFVSYNDTVHGAICSKIQNCRGKF
jgi:hypothetical protein